MQTFLVYPDFRESARILDYKRLGKQRPECKQIYFANTVPGYAWSRHPMVVMWAGFEYALLEYAQVICKEWIRRGYNDSLLVEFEEYQVRHKDTGLPPWLGNDRFHRSHRSNLLRKDPVFYGQYGWKEPDNLPYYWPVG